MEKQLVEEISDGVATRHERHLAERAQTLQDARKPMHADPSTILLKSYGRSSLERAEKPALG
jgi:hypothetical protein